MVALMFGAALAAGIPEWEGDYLRQQGLAKLGTRSSQAGAGLVAAAVVLIVLVDDTEVVLAAAAPFYTLGSISMIGGNTSGSLFAWRAARSLQAGGIDVSTVPAKVGLAGVGVFYATALLMPVLSDSDVRFGVIAVPAYGGLATMYAGSIWQVRTNKRAYDLHVGPTQVSARW